MTNYRAITISLETANRFSRFMRGYSSADAALTWLMDIYEGKPGTWAGLPVGQLLCGVTGLRRCTRRRHFARVVKDGIEVHGRLYGSLSAGANAAALEGGRTGKRSGLDFWIVVEEGSGRRISVRQFQAERA